MVEKPVNPKCGRARPWLCGWLRARRNDRAARHDDNSHGDVQVMMIAATSSSTATALHASYYNNAQPPRGQQQAVVAS